jgi:hypothetical protein
VVRGLMRGPDATPLIIRSKCVQHYSVFLAAIRPKGELVHGLGHSSPASMDTGDPSAPLPANSCG